MGADEKVNIEAELSAIEARARVRRRWSAFLTLIPVASTCAVVLVFASDIAKKRLELAAIEQQKKKLDDELRDKQEKLSRAAAEGQALDAKIEELNKDRNELEDYLRRLRLQVPGASDAGAAKGPDSVVLTSTGEAPSKFRVVPRATVKPRRSGRAYDVTLSLDITAGDPNSIDQVEYVLSPVYFDLKTAVMAYDAPFEGKFTVFGCRSTVMVKVLLKDGSNMELDFDWCSAEGWPLPKQEEVEHQASPQRKPRESESPNITRPLPGEPNRQQPMEDPRFP